LSSVENVEPEADEGRFRISLLTIILLTISNRRRAACAPVRMGGVPPSRVRVGAGPFPRARAHAHTHTHTHRDPRKTRTSAAADAAADGGEGGRAGKRRRA
jgi:hypothetical protein